MADLIADKSDEIISIKCEYTLADVREVMKYAIRRARRANRKQSIIYFAVIITMVVGMFEYIGYNPMATKKRPLTFDDFLFPWGVWLGFLIAVVIFARSIRRAMVSRQFNRFGPLQRPHEFEFRPDCVWIREPLATHQYQWEAFPRWAETAGKYLLFVSESAFHIVTKRSFTDTATLLQFRQMLRSRIDHQRTAHQAFPVVPVV